MITMPTTTPKMKTAIRFLLAIVLAILPVRAGFAQTYTLSPSPFLLAQNNSGAIINNACVWTYAAGTTTAATTYSDNAGTPNLNPIRSDSAGRFTAYLLAGSSYKFVYEAACTPPAHGTVLVTRDNVAAVPASAASVDVTGTAGETISAGQCAYLSDGSGSKNAGQWYKCDTANAYSSTAPEVGIATNAILSAASGTIRIAGSVTGLTSLSLGSNYYAGTAGALTSTAPVQRRLLGVADSATSLVLTPNPSVPVTAWVNDFRLTLTTGVPITSADVTAATTLYCAPLTGNRIDLPDSVGNPNRVTSAQFSIAIPATTSQMYTVWAFSNSGVAALELQAWTNDTTPGAADPVRTNGRLLKSGDSTRMYLGIVRTTTVSGQTEDSLSSRFLQNYYNAVRRPVKKIESTDSWNYTTATWRAYNNSATNAVGIITGQVDKPIVLTALALSANATGDIPNYTAIGQDSTTTPMSGVLGAIGRSTSTAIPMQIRADITFYPTVGYHLYTMLERSGAGGTTTFYGDNGDTTLSQAGIFGWFEG